MTNSEISANQETNVQEIAEVIEEFEKYRERLLNDTLEAAKRAKLMKSAVMAKLEPELAKIDTIIENLRNQQAALNSNQ